MKKNWLSGVWLLLTMLICSVSFADVRPSVMPVATFDVVSVADIQPTGSINSVGAMIKPDDYIFANAGAGSKGMVADTRDRQGSIAGNCGSCHETDNNKAHGNVTAYMAKPDEVGWR